MGECPFLCTPYTFTYTPYTFTRTPYTFIYTPRNDYKPRVTITILRVTITISPVLLKMQKSPIFRVLLGIKKTETPIFQGISVVLPKLYLGGRSDRSRTCGIHIPNVARYQLRYTPKYAIFCQP